MSVEQDIHRAIRSQVNNTVILKKEDEVDLVKRWQDNRDIEARNALVDAHSRLIAGWASRFSNSGADFSDLYNEGVLALIHAADRFDTNMKNRFSSYAVWWILPYMQDAVHRDIYGVKIGRSRSERKALRLLGTARSHFGPNLTKDIIERIAELSGNTPEVIEKIDGAIASRSISLNSTIGNDNEEGAEAGDFIECPTARDFNADDSVLNIDQKSIILDCLSGLRDPRAGKIIQERWLQESDNKTERSLQEIGADLNISAERVRQIERDALIELRNELKNRGYNMGDLIS